MCIYVLIYVNNLIFILIYADKTCGSVILITLIFLVTREALDFEIKRRATVFEKNIESLQRDMRFSLIILFYRHNNALNI